LVLPLAAEFPAPTRDEWRALVDKVLKGADFHKKLVSRTPDGIEVQPLYVGGDDLPDGAGFPGSDPFTRGAGASPRHGGAWDVRVSVDHPDVVEANRILLDELLRGATSLAVRLGDGGVSVASADDLERLLDGVHLDLLPVALGPGADFAAQAQCQRLGPAFDGGSRHAEPDCHLFVGAPIDDLTQHVDRDRGPSSAAV